MTIAPTSYDTVAYPSMIFAKTHPDRLAVIARLHGLAAPATETARVLQIGGGDGLDAIALAAAFPHATFVNFDIAAQPIERGRRWSEAAGIANVRHEIIDILDAADRLDGPFDYIVAHGIYAWVPDFVRAAVMPLICRMLAPNGVAFVSYNAFPGGHSRVALREMMRHRVAHLTDPAAQLVAVRSLLRDFASSQPNDEPITAAMRREAEAALTYSDGLLFHDGLNECYAPQSLLAVTGDARAHGLRYLGDAAGGGLDKGFLDPGHAGISENALLDRLQALDYSNGRYFRSSLFVPKEATFSRVADHHAARSMWATTDAIEAGENQFRTGKATISIADPRRADALRRLVARKPAWAPVAELADDDMLLASICHLALEGIIDLCTVPPPFALVASDRPVASPLARLQLAHNERRIATLDHRLIDFGDEGLRRLLLHLDGTRNRAALAALHPGVQLDRALQQIAASALLKA